MADDRTSVVSPSRDASPPAVDALPRQDVAGVASPPPRRPRFGGRRRLWTWGLSVVLLAVGLLNVYPFLWMGGTSLKSQSEAAGERQRPIPRYKYSLTEAAREQLNHLTADAPVAAPDADVVPTGIPANARQWDTLDSLRQEDSRRLSHTVNFVADSITVREYAEHHGLDRERARAELDQLVAEGLLTGRYLQLDNYRVVWSDMKFYLHFMTSIVLTLGVVGVTLLMTTMLGYALARLRFPGKMWVLGLLILGAVAPQEATIIPIFRMLNALYLFDNLWGMTLWIAGFSVGHTLLMAGYFFTLPKEIEEAATVDGAGPFRTFFDVALPMARPIVATVGLFAFLMAWNDFLIPLIATMSRPDMQPLAVAVFSFQRGHQGEWHHISAAAAIMIVPVIVLFIFLQRHVIRSIAVGAVKG
ncbi:MAG: ABC transporter permease subunit [Phycisphaeraceae bacterium]